MFYVLCDLNMTIVRTQGSRFTLEMAAALWSQLIFNELTPIWWKYLHEKVIQWSSTTKIGTNSKGNKVSTCLLWDSYHSSLWNHCWHVFYNKNTETCPTFSCSFFSLLEWRKSCWAKIWPSEVSLMSTVVVHLLKHRIVSGSRICNFWKTTALYSWKVLWWKQTGNLRVHASSNSLLCMLSS